MSRLTTFSGLSAAALVLTLAPSAGLAAPAPSCAGAAATIVGTAGDDRLTGTDAADVIVALAGNDVIFGLDGDDLVCGGEGFDTLDGGVGDDYLDGGAGGDGLEMGFSDVGVSVDLELSGAPQDTGQGLDTLVSLSEVYGSPHDDVIRGTNTNGTVFEFLAGGDGQDDIDGRGGDDRIDGGWDDDRLQGGSGSDRISGDAGKDTVLAADGEPDVLRCTSGGDLVESDDHDVLEDACRRAVSGGSAEPVDGGVWVVEEHESSEVTAVDASTPGESGVDVASYDLATPDGVTSESAASELALEPAQITVAAGQTLRGVAHKGLRVVASCSEACRIKVRASLGGRQIGTVAVTQLWAGSRAATVKLSAAGRRLVGKQRGAKKIALKVSAEQSSGCAQGTVMTPLLRR